MTFAYTLCRNDYGHYFCYFGCTGTATKKKEDVIAHLVYEHRNEVDKLAALGMRWRLLAD